MMRKILFTLLFAFTLTAAKATVPKHTADSIASLLNRREVVCNKSCPLFASEKSNAGLVNTIFIDILAIIGTVWLYTNYKKKYFIGIGGAVVIIVTGSLFLRNSGDNKCIEYANDNCKAIEVKQTKAKADGSGLSDFEQMDSTTASASKASNDEFSSFDSSTAVAAIPASVASPPLNMSDPLIMDPLIALAILALVAIGMRYPSFVRFRGLFLLVGVAWFGFYRGGCECMIDSFQSLVLGIGSQTFAWKYLIWLGVLIIATYLFGRTWCGWLCHLGGIQDFLFRSSKIKILTSEKSQRYLRTTRYVIFTAWVLQLILMRKNVFCQYDPFKSLFNLIFTDWISVVLLILLLVSSVLIYRPFCRTICPVGVILGWISLLPGARKMRIKTGCTNCGACSKGCDMHAIERTSDKSVIHHEYCIACGECTTTCRKGYIKNDIK
jgi:ferredoxin